MAGYKALFQLDGKVALVTGAACGIGSEACRACLRGRSLEISSWM